MPPKAKATENEPFSSSSVDDDMRKRQASEDQLYGRDKLARLNEWCLTLAQLAAQQDHDGFDTFYRRQQPYIDRFCDTSFFHHFSDAQKQQYRDLAASLDHLREEYKAIKDISAPANLLRFPSSFTHSTRPLTFFPSPPPQQTTTESTPSPLPPKQREPADQTGVSFIAKGAFRKGF